MTSSKPTRQFVGAKSKDLGDAKPRQESPEAPAVLREFSRAGSDWFWETDATHKLTWVTEHESRTPHDHIDIIGRRRDQLPGVEAKDWAWHQHLLDLEARRPFRGFRYRATLANGKTHYIEVSGKPRFDAQGAFLGYRGVGLDVTKYVVAQELAEDAHRRLANAIDEMPSTILLTGPDDRVITANRAWFQLNTNLDFHSIQGLTFGEILTKVAEAGLIPPAKNRVPEWLENRLAQRQNSSLPFEQMRQDGKWVLIYDKRLKDGSTITVGTDITALKRTETALRESESNAASAHIRLMEAIESISEGFALFDAEDRLILRNTNALKMFGPDADLIRIGTRFEDIIRGRVARNKIPDARDDPEAWVQNRLQEHRRPGAPIEQRQVDGRWIRFGKQSVSSGGIVTILTDITDLKEAEQRLRDSHDRLQMIVDANPIPTVITRASDGIVLFANRHFVEAAGWDDGHVIGRDIHDHFENPSDRALVVSLIEQHGRVDGLEVRARKGNGEQYWIEVSAQPVTLDGETAYFSAFRDVTDRKRSEENLRQTQKLEAIGTLAGGIAHDFNNILQIVGGFTQMALDEPSESSSTRENLKIVLRNVERARDLISKILTFSRQQSVEKQTVDLGAAIRDVIEMIRATLPSSIEIKTEIETSALFISGDPTQVHQVVVNLCTNAAKALTDASGIISVNLDRITLESPEIMVGGILQPGSYVRLSVQDSGSGIDPAIRDRIFEPFFSTRPVGEGTGLGLAVVHGIMTEHEGGIRVESQLGEGTRFSVYWPASDACLPPADGNVSSAEEPGNLENSQEHDRTTEHVADAMTVLLVDDEPDLRKLGKRILERAGYHVVTAESGDTAYRTWMNDSETIDLVVTDHMMPGMTGTALAARIRQTHPDLPIILCTGYNDIQTEESAEELRVSACILKPLGSRALLTTVAELIAGRDGKT